MVLIALLVTVCALVLLYYKRSFSYWKRNNVPYVEPIFPFGNVGNPITRKQGLHNDLTDVYFALKAKACKHGGFYTMSSPVYMPIHVDYVRNILVKDFDHFVNHGIYFNEKDDPLSGHLFAINDEKWKNMRAKLTPAFTSGKMKLMFQTLKDCAVPLIEEINKLSGNNQALDFNDLASRFSTDVIGSCAFGVECNSFKDPDAKFMKYGKKCFEMDFISKMKVFILISLPQVARAIRIVLTKKDVSRFFLSMVKTTMKYREDHNISRPDLMQLLIGLKNSSDDLTFNEISAQAFIFFQAGFEGSSTTMTFCLYEIAKNQDIQDKLRKEIDSTLAKYNEEITYEGINEMKYLGQVINETLRKYPPLTMLFRVCNKTYQVPDTDVVIEKGTNAIIPLYAIQHDPEYYPNPEIFNPDRFSDENKNKQIPHTFLSFGEGPRNCIGLRFSLMQTKIGLATILKNFRFTLNKATPRTMKLDPNAFIMAFQDSLYLNAEKI